MTSLQTEHTSTATPDQRSAGSDTGAVLITGATGSVGSELVVRWRLLHPKTTIVILVRADDELEADDRRLQLLEALFEEKARLHDPFVLAVAGDITLPRFGLDPARWTALAEQVDEVVHAAASIELGLDELTAHETNVLGTEHVLQFAAECQLRGGLRRITHVSSTFIAGDHNGIFRERNLWVGQTLHTAYQRSKYLAERVVRGWDLPHVICRLGMVVGDQHSGWLLKPNAIYLALKLLVDGHVPEIPSDPETPMDFITVDYAADAVYHLAQSGNDGATYHVVAADRAITIARFVELVKDAFPEVITRLVPPTPEALAVLAAAAPNLTMKATNDDALARKVLAGVGLPRAPEFDERVFRAVARYAVASEWGYRPMSRVGALRRSRRGG